MLNGVFVDENEPIDSIVMCYFKAKVVSGIGISDTPQNVPGISVSVIVTSCIVHLK